MPIFMDIPLIQTTIILGAMLILAGAVLYPDLAKGLGAFIVLIAVIAVIGTIWQYIVIFGSIYALVVLILLILIYRKK